MKTKLNIKKGDEIKVLAGKDKGKTGKVLEVRPADSRIIAEGLNLHVRYSKSKNQKEKGQKMHVPGAIPVSKVMLVCPNCGKPTRVSREVTDSGTFRKCKKCGKTMN
jgi:large subunit ribosomal protein L24